MVSVLTALASRAGLTLLDEPTAGLDAVAREQFYRLLLEDFSHTGRTFVLSTHIIGEAAPLFEEVLILNGGRITEHGPTDELLELFRTVSGPAEQTEAALPGADRPLPPGRRAAQAVHRPGHAGAAGGPGRLRLGHGPYGASGGVYRPVRPDGRRWEVRT